MWYVSFYICLSIFYNIVYQLWHFHNKIAMFHFFFRKERARLWLIYFDTFLRIILAHVRTSVGDWKEWKEESSRLYVRRRRERELEDRQEWLVGWNKKREARSGGEDWVSKPDIDNVI